MAHLHFHSLFEINNFLGLSAPAHPLIDVATLPPVTSDELSSCPDLDHGISSDFFTISLKHVTEGEILYGRTRFDYQSGSLLFSAPGQVFVTQGIKVKSSGRTLSLHPDFVWGHEVQQQLRKARFFDYAVHEALHLSPEEQNRIIHLFNNIEAECQNNYDEFSKEIILAHLSTLLKYADRFYRRQFLMRKESHSSIEQKFIGILQSWADETSTNKPLPTVESIAKALSVTPRYLSDALKVETGKTAIEHIHLFVIDLAKEQLLGSEASVATIAYTLGFEYPQYFSRLFKQQVGMTPTQYREQTH